MSLRAQLCMIVVKCSLADVIVLLLRNHPEEVAVRTHAAGMYTLLLLLYMIVSQTLHRATFRWP